MKRVFIIVLDSVGVGEAPDAALYQDEGSNTLKSVSEDALFAMPNMKKLGLFNIDGIGTAASLKEECPEGTFMKLQEASKGKDTTTGHWEIAGLVSEKPMPVYPDGFPGEIIEAFEQQTGRGVLCNLPYSGTDVIRDYGREHIKTGKLIVYTSADSVFQIAAHEDIVPVEELYRCCEIARKLLTGKHSVGRVIARPFTGEYPHFERTSRRHDFSLHPTGKTMLDAIKEAGMEVLSVGKIVDIFAGDGITDFVRTADNTEGMEKTLDYMKREFTGLCFTNLVDFDMVYGHRNDTAGYAKALSGFDAYLPKFLEQLKEDDILMITADHGCDPGTLSTDHSREYVPLVIVGNKIKKNNNLGIRKTFADIAATVLDYLDVECCTKGTSMLKEILCTDK